MTKSPTRAFAKTRLAATLGDAAAQRIASALLTNAIENCSEVGGASKICAYSGSSESIAPYLKEGWECVPVQTEHHPDAIASIVDEMFTRGFQRVLVTSSDTPGLSPRVMAGLLLALDVSPFVMAESADGGITALATRERTDWIAGTKGLNAKSFAVEARQRGGLVEFPILTDVDHEEDLRRVLHRGEIAWESPLARVFRTTLRVGRVHRWIEMLVPLTFPIAKPLQRLRSNLDAAHSPL